ncbi:5'-methylthioadenosine/adenosylhomocysteine nucleosidase [Flavobacterium sp. RHBU_3]|uniref:5'-methylthioadenosine/adenosylhomocysteine nucleosidase n=1 Tax=Flavobacterium sp. RHBU_3 TaxID=3391184 RepID=UPI003984A601
MTDTIIGIMGAMPQEINGIIPLIQSPLETTIGRRTYTHGTINGIRVVLVFSRWGKVAAAATTATLINEFKVSRILFMGVAGGIAPELNIGDVVVADRLIQHDIDARPIMEEFQIPLLGKKFLDADATYRDKAAKAISQLILRTPAEGYNPKVIVGDIASGDRFFATSADKQNLLAKLPTIQCVEMEGAAVAQVCFEHDIPLTVIRIISDTADEESPADFLHFIETVASTFSSKIIEALFLAE